MKRGAGIIGAALCVLSLHWSGTAAAEKGQTGIEGLTAFRGEFIQGAVVMAFPDAGPGPDAVPVATSGPTDGSGRYRLLLPPAKYYLVAVKSDSKKWPPSYGPGDLFCYYLGNPVPVEAGRMTHVGFNMTEVAAEEPPLQSKRSGIEGRVLFEGKPLARSYIYVYRDSATNFRGMGAAVLPSGENGKFRVRLAPGTYYLLARKRKAGGMYGPPQKDDYIGYYSGNPIEVREGEFRKVTLEATTRVDLLEEIWYQEGKDAGWFGGTVVDSRDRPVSGLYVLFYLGSETAGMPAFIAGPTGEEGGFRARIAPGRYRLLVRGSIGGPPTAGEWYGSYRGPGGEQEVEAASGGKIRIVVTPYAAP